MGAAGNTLDERIRLCPLLFVVQDPLSVRSTSQPVLRAFMHFHQRDDRETKVLKRTRARFKSVNDGLILPLPRLTG